MRKKGRGIYEEATTTINGVNIIVVKWFDNKPVHLLSTFIGAHPTANVKRWDKLQNKYMDVECSNLVSQYNKYMDGVDLMDSLTAL